MIRLYGHAAVFHHTYTHFKDINYAFFFVSIKRCCQAENEQNTCTGFFVMLYMDAVQKITSRSVALD